MDVPHDRRNLSVESTLRWLLSNLGKSNSKHPDYSRAKTLLKNRLQELEAKAKKAEDV
jgi:hypothetical protein